MVGCNSAETCIVTVSVAIHPFSSVATTVISPAVFTTTEEVSPGITVPPASVHT